VDDSRCVDTERTSPPSLWRDRRLWVLAFAGWNLFCLISVVQNLVSSRLKGTSSLTLRGVLGDLEAMWLWALVTPLIFACCDYFPLVRPRWVRNLGVHLVLCVFILIVDVGIGALLSPWVGYDPSRPFLLRMARSTFICFFSYFAVVGVGHAIRFHRLYVERLVRASELESQLLRAQFLALQMQLRPHFLFNALNTITGLIRTGNSRGAIQMTAGLADLLRVVLRSDGTQQVPLHQELEFVERYLRIEQLRFQERLHTRIHVDPEARDALVPHLLLQPLVENAVRHGSRDEAENRVDIQVTLEEDMLWLRVRDTGDGPVAREDTVTEPGVPAEGGIGLTNTRARLRHLYGEAHRLELLHAEGGGALAQVAIPFRRAGTESRQ
jgi:two-component system, LytTR family, sensor kinase